MPSWLQPALWALLMFGLWGFFPKLAVTYLDHKSAVVYQVIGSLLVGLLMLVSVKFQPAVNARGIFFAILTGITGVAGTLFFFAAAERGRISLVVSVTALYPLITILLAALFLKEPITLKHLAGMVCAVVALLLLSS
ncbi:MAG: EamA family transporter [Proteobacteria bacterium]|nr:EamA family transporter [Pseudomonadota bacterium]MBU1739686.1 EamA family transporter [Pseudomonadota bacterium]